MTIYFPELNALECIMAGVFFKLLLIVHSLQVQDSDLVALILPSTRVTLL